jgi:3-oxoacyl-[acyl-carrier protein] reductase
MSYDFTHKTALVTGASRGIGRAIAQRLARDGAHVGVHYASDEYAANQTLQTIRAAGGRAFPVQADLGDDTGVDNLIDGLHRELRGTSLDILVNNAAVVSACASIEQTTCEHFDHLFRVNVRAPFFIIQRVLPLLTNGGRIVNISSADTRIAVPAELAYTMTKGAINVLARTLAPAVGARGITVNTVAPGVTDTGKLDWMYANPAAEAATRSASAMGRIGRPDDVASVVAFLASDEAGWITGQLLDASGGMFLGPPISLPAG